MSSVARILMSCIVGGLVLCATQAGAQTAQEAAEYNALLAQYNAVKSSLSAPQRAEVESLFRSLRSQYGATGNVLAPLAKDRIGTLSTNPYLPGSTSSPASTYLPQSPANPYGEYGSPYSPDGAQNPYATGGLDIVGDDGTYLGKLNANPYDPNSVANPYGRYGSAFSPDSINNPYGKFGSPYSPSSASNPYATSPPGLYRPLTPSVLPQMPSLGTLPSVGTLPSIGTLPTLPALPALGGRRR